MPPVIRPVERGDIPTVVALLARDAETRRSLDPLLWRVAADAPARIEKAVAASLAATQAPARPLWLVAEDAGRICGVMHAMLVPVPPIYDGSDGHPGLLLDDCYLSLDAPSGTGEALLAATQAALTAAGAPRLIASCPAAASLRALYEREGYEPVTLYMAKHGLRAEDSPSTVRPARAEDISSIVRHSSKHRRTLAEINSRFWHIHPEADARFGAWMQRSLTFKDRDMLVAIERGEVRGYVVAQPIAPMLLPIANEIAPIGVIDDYYDLGFADVAGLAKNAASGEDLLAAAESAFARRGVHSTLVVCPAKWASKISLLERNGYRTAKMWMLKR